MGSSLQSNHIIITPTSTITSVSQNTFGSMRRSGRYNHNTEEENVTATAELVIKRATDNRTDMFPDILGPTTAADDCCCCTAMPNYSVALLSVNVIPGTYGSVFTLSLIHI